jgi:hypothetical protein
VNAVVTACCRTAARYLAVLLLTAGLLAALPAAAVYARQQSQEEPPVVVPASPRAEKDSQTATTAIEAVELCFSLDCSARMLAPLPRALAAIEAIVAQTEAAYPKATLRLALVRYGDSTRRVAARGFTEDRKAFAAMLADTKLNKDSIDDYLGAFLERALRMGWSPGNDGRVAKRLYVIGSETPYSNAPRQLYRRLIPQARAQGIVVSTVFCPAPNRAFIPQGPMGTPVNWCGRRSSGSRTGCRPQPWAGARSFR